MSKDEGSNVSLQTHYVSCMEESLFIHSGKRGKDHAVVANERANSLRTNGSQSLDSSLLSHRQTKAERNDAIRQQAKETLDEKLNNIFTSVNGSLSNIEHRLRQDSLEAEELNEIVHTLVEHQQALGFQYQQLRNHAEQLDNDLNSNTNSDYLCSPEVTASKNKIEDIIVNHLTKVEARIQLGSAERTHQFLSDTLTLHRVRKERYQFYYYLPVALLLAMWTVIIGFELSSSSASYWVVVLRVVRGPLLTLTFVYLIALNISGWARVRIDYVQLFSIKYVRSITPKDTFRFAGIVTMLFGVLLVVVMFASATESIIPLLMIGLSMWLGLLVLILNPFHVMQRGARFSFVRSFIRIMLTPFYAINFGDAWLADQLLSTIAVMLDFEYLICYLSVVIWDPDEDVSYCLSSSNGIRPFIVALPAVWRLLQCLRSFYDTTSSNHLLNAGKYLSSLPVIAFSTVYELASSSRYMVLLAGQLDNQASKWIVWGWVLTAAVNVLCSFLWDVFCDWKLIQFAHGHVPHIRRQRLYHRKKWYCLIIPLDFVLRVLSTLKLIFTIMRNVPHSETIFTLLIFCEFFRRFVWNYFRVEVESLIHQPANNKKATSIS